MGRVNSVPRLVCGLTLALTFFLCAPASSAHARLERSEPKANSTLKQPPKTLELWFSEELEASMSTVTVSDDTGRRVDKNNATVAEGNKKLQIDLADLGPGTYTVDWKALSADGHTMKGKFTFTIEPAGGGAATARTTTPTAGVQQVGQPKQTGQPASTQTSPAESTQVSGSSWAQSVVRWLEYLAMTTLCGGFAFRLLILGPVLRGLEVDERAKGLSASARQFVELSWWALALLALATLAALVLQTSTVMDISLGEALSPARLYEVLTRTSYGAPWLLQAATAAVLALILFLLARRTSDTDYERHLSSAANPGLLRAGVIVSALMMLAPSLTGHARAATQYHFTVFSDWLHLVAAGFWVGGLFHLALTMARGVAGLEGRGWLRVLERAVPPFTKLAVAGTVVIALTGAYNSWIHVDRFSALWSTPYGEALSVKIILFLVMVALGGLNTFVIHPRAKRMIDDAGGALTREHLKLDRSFYRAVGVEAVLGGVVLLAAAVLVYLQPAREHPTNTARADTSGPTVVRVER